MSKVPPAASPRLGVRCSERSGVSAELASGVSSVSSRLGVSERRQSRRNRCSIGVQMPNPAAASGGGSLSDIETTVAMSAKDAHATFEADGKAAKDFRSAGRS